jgi:hypothetical protein
MEKYFKMRDLLQAAPSPGQETDATAPRPMRVKEQSIVNQEHHSRNCFVWMRPGDAEKMCEGQEYREQKIRARIRLRTRDLQGKLANINDPRERQKITDQIAGFKRVHERTPNRTVIKAWEVHEIITGACYFFGDFDAPKQADGCSNIEAFERQINWVRCNASTYLNRLEPQGGDKVWGYATFLTICRTDCKDKLSAHISGSGPVFRHANDVGYFVENILKPAAEKDGVDLSFIDMQVYKTKQMRVPGSSKWCFEDGKLVAKRKLGQTTSKQGPGGKMYWCNLNCKRQWAHPTARVPHLTGDLSYYRRVSGRVTTAPESEDEMDLFDFEDDADIERGVDIKYVKPKKISIGSAVMVKLPKWKKAFPGVVVEIRGKKCDVQFEPETD